MTWTKFQLRSMDDTVPCWSLAACVTKLHVHIWSSDIVRSPCTSFYNEGGSVVALGFMVLVLIRP